MSSSVRSFFRSKKLNLNQEKFAKELSSQRSLSRLPIVENRLSTNFNQWLTNVNHQQKSVNISCCGGDEKKNAIKNQTKAPRLIKETVGHAQALADPMEASDHKIEHIVQQHAPKVEMDDDLKDLFGKKEITKAIINQLAQRALTGPMNSNNDNSPRLCTKKHVRN
jgi:hypothetical protein